jgi:hypothetical protein
MSDREDLLSRVASGNAITKEEADFLQSALVLSCKGPYRSEKHKAEYAEIRSKMGTTGGGGTGYDIGLLDSLNRQGCGYNFNQVVMQFPYDGREHYEPCPKCGQMISFRSPYWPVSG